jgi:uncharacterized protein (TIGR02569 family)
VVPLAGGQGRAFTAGDVILKQVIDEGEATWIAETLLALPDPSTFRLIRPVPARDGRWVVGGWSAWQAMPGRVVPGSWRDALAVSGAFHHHVAGLVASGPPRRTHPWAIGDRYAWDEEHVEIDGPLAAVVARLQRDRVPLDLPNQLIHGDLINNILFDAHLPPAVIDVSPYWRPARYADAIIVVDAIGWNGAGAEAAVSLRDDVGRQLLLRATLFRLASALLLFRKHATRLASELSVYERLEAVIYQA